VAEADVPRPANERVAPAMSAVVITASFQLDLFERPGISYLRCKLDLIQIKSLCPETPASPISLR
jgi:hypothetical protein